MLLERLKALREKAKVKQEDLANSIHTSRGTYSMYENGRRQPPYEVLVNLADYYNVSVDYLLGLTDCPDAPGSEKAAVGKRDETPGAPNAPQ